MRWRTGLSSIMSGAMRSKEPAILTNPLPAADPDTNAGLPPMAVPGPRYLPTENLGGPGRHPESE